MEVHPPQVPQQPQNGTISELLCGLKRGEADAAQAIWDRFFHRLVALARKKLDGLPKRASDEEDVALSVLDALCRGARAGRFGDLSDRRSLWNLLLHITSQRVAERRRRERRQRRGSCRIRGESVLGDGSPDGEALRPASLDELAADQPTPEFLVALQDEHDRLLSMLEDPLRQIALAAMEGYTSNEIAAQLGVSVRTIQRKLRLIHGKWSRVSVP